MPSPHGGRCLNLGGAPGGGRGAGSSLWVFLGALLPPAQATPTCPGLNAARLQVAAVGTDPCGQEPGAASPSCLPGLPLRLRLGAGQALGFHLTGWQPGPGTAEQAPILRLGTSLVILLFMLGWKTLCKLFANEG